MSSELFLKKKLEDFSFFPKKNDLIMEYPIALTVGVLLVGSNLLTAPTCCGIPRGQPVIGGVPFDDNLTQAVHAGSRRPCCLHPPALMSDSTYSPV